MINPPPHDDRHTDGSDADLRALQVVSAQMVVTLERIDDADWVRSTPCGDWDLRALVDHVVGGNWFTCAVLDGRSADDAMAETVAGFGHGPIDVASTATSIAYQLDAFERADVLDRRWQHVAGELTGRAMIRLRLHDLIVHLWDIQTSLALADPLPPELIAWGLEELADHRSIAATHFGVGTLGVPGRGSKPVDDYLRPFGRV